MPSPRPHYTPDGGPFALAAVEHPSGGNRPFLLDGDTVWLVRRGHVDVFAVHVEGGQPVGARMHLLRVGEGEALFGLGATRAGRRIGLLAVGANGAQLLRAPRAALDAHAPDPDGRRETTGLIEAWVEALCGGVGRQVAPARAVELALGAGHRVAERTALRPPAGVVWVKHAEGHSLLFGRDGVALNGLGYTPVGRPAWLDALPGSRIDVTDGAGAAAAGELWSGLDRLHGLALGCVAALADERTAAERGRASRRAAARESTLAAACFGLAGVMEPEAAVAARRAARPADAELDRDIAGLVAAARIVGDAAGVEIKPPPTTRGGPRPRDPLAAIARASRCRTRRVVLRDEWWQQDAGPLLGYRAESLAPVALLPESRRGQPGYVLHDPATGTVERVTAAVSERLSPLADALYRPFPNRALTVRDVIAFGLQGCRRDLKVVLLMSVCAALLGLLPAIVTGVIFNTIIPGAQRSQLFQLTAVLVVCALSMAMFEITRAVALLRIEGRMGNAIQSAVWDRLLGLPTSFFRPYTAGELASRAMGIDAIRQVVSGTTVTALVGGVFSISYFGLLFYYSAALAKWATLLIVIALLVSMVGSWLQLATQRKIYLLQGRSTGAVLQLLSNVAKLRVANAEVQAFALWARQFGQQRSLQFRARTVANRVATFNAAFPVLANMLLFWMALQMITEGGTLRTGDFLAFMSAFVSCVANVIATSSALLASFNTIPLYEQARPILTALPEVDERKADPGSLSGSIEVQHAVFRYSPDSPPTLRDVTLTIAPGEFVAFVGASGSGKSTLLRVLLGFETLGSGAVYFDGQDLAGLDVQAVRRQMGVVLQNGRLLSGDIFSNIVGSGLATVDDAWEAARMAGFDDDIRAMPMGMHTMVSEGGGTLSGGQRQRLMIARAIVHRPRVLLFDEATSALDNRTQSIVSGSLERLQATRVVVAHRLSTIQKADRIYVVERGTIAQQGSFDELMTRDGPFRELARRQLA